METAVWIAQGLLAAVFAMAVATKLLRSKAERLTQPSMAWVEDFDERQIKGIGTLEVAAAVRAQPARRDRVRRRAVANGDLRPVRIIRTSGKVTSGVAFPTRAGLGLTCAQLARRSLIRQPPAHSVGFGGEQAPETMQKHSKSRRPRCK